MSAALRALVATALVVLIAAAPAAAAPLAPFIEQSGSQLTCKRARDRDAAAAPLAARWAAHRPRRDLHAGPGRRRSRHHLHRRGGGDAGRSVRARRSAWTWWRCALQLFGNRITGDVGAGRGGGKVTVTLLRHGGDVPVGADRHGPGDGRVDGRPAARAHPRSKATACGSTTSGLLMPENRTFSVGAEGLDTDAPLALGNVIRAERLPRLLPAAVHGARSAAAAARARSRSTRASRTSAAGWSPPTTSSSSRRSRTTRPGARWPASSPSCGRHHSRTRSRRPPATATSPPTRCTATTWPTASTRSRPAARACSCAPWSGRAVLGGPAVRQRRRDRVVRPRSGA